MKQTLGYLNPTLNSQAQEIKFNHKLFCLHYPTGHTRMIYDVRLAS